VHEIGRVWGLGLGLGIGRMVRPAVGMRPADEEVGYVLERLQARYGV
jgi:hypothetical protein